MRTAHTLRVALLATFAAALLIAGCGGGGPHEPTDEQQTAIDETFASYKAAVADGDGEATCEVVAPDSVEQLGGAEECAKVYDKLLKAYATALDGVEIDRIEVADDDSIARMYFVDTEVPLRFQPVGEDWLIVPPDALTGGSPSASE